MKGMSMRLWVGAACILCCGAPRVLRAADEAAEVYPFAILTLPGASADSFQDKFPGNDMLPYTPDDITLPTGGNSGGTWGFAHFDINSDNKIDPGEHIFVVAAGGAD